MVERPRPLVVTVVRTFSLTYVMIQMFVTRGRTQRSAPTRSLYRKAQFRDETTTHRDASTAQAENVFVAILRKALNNRNAREGTAALPYAEIWHPTSRQYQ